jgi:hypothetical protein
MLLSMQPPTSAAPANSSRSFAGLLAAIAFPDKTRQPESDLDEGDEDVASLSYEQALRSHSPFDPVSPTNQPAAAPAANPLTSMKTVDRRTVTVGSGPLDSAKPQGSNTPSQSGRRCSSVTVRLSAPESEQLHLRAAEAGMTVSAYLRSCTFEVESLREEVKTALSQLRSLDTTKQEPAPSGKRRSCLRFFKLPSRARSQRVTN